MRVNLALNGQPRGHDVDPRTLLVHSQEEPNPWRIISAAQMSLFELNSAPNSELL